METAQERELQGRQDWPLDMMTSLDTSNNNSSSSNCFLFEWDPQFSYFGLGVGVGVGDAEVHELFPLYMESPVSSEASTAAAGLPPAQDAMAMPEELDDLLQNFWDANSYGDVGEQVTFNSSCIVQEKSTTSFLDDDPLSSIFSEGYSLQEKIVPRPQAELLCSSSSDCRRDPRISDLSGVPQQTTDTPRDPKFPSFPPSSSKRFALEETECSHKSKRKKVSTGVVCPFGAVKPDGLDGGATLADINKRILMRPARPVRHPVGEFACRPRMSIDKPAPSGKMVVSLTRLHTQGSGTITIIRTRG